MKGANYGWYIWDSANGGPNKEYNKAVEIITKGLK
jgi:hypothetical protein